MMGPSPSQAFARPCHNTPCGLVPGKSDAANLLHQNSRILSRDQNDTKTAARLILIKRSETGQHLVRVGAANGRDMRHRQSTQFGQRLGNTP